jgi:hypothetical protein
MYVNWDSYIVASYLKVLIPVGTAIITVAKVKYARVTPYIPTVNIRCAHNTSHSNPIAVMAKIVPRYKLVYTSLHCKICNLILECNVRNIVHLSAISDVANLC